MSFPCQEYPLTTTTTLSSCTSIYNKKISPSTLQQAISILKKQLRQCKLQQQEQSNQHKQDTFKYQKQIQLLKRKILHMSEKQYLKSVLSQDIDDERMKQTTLDNNYRKLKLYSQKLQSDIGQKQRQIDQLTEMVCLVKKQKQTINKQKQKHLQLSIVEKINLQERINVLQKQVHSKQSFITALKSQSLEISNKQIKLKKLQRRLLKKVNELQNFQDQMKSLNQFQHSKLKKRIDSLLKENQFLKEHIEKLQSQFNNAECLCSNKECKQQINLFKNKYINKSRELSKVKVQLSKEIFKEQFLKQLKNKQNLLTASKKSVEKYKQTKKYNYLDDETQTKKHSRNRNQQDQDEMLFKLTQNDEEVCRNQNIPPKYKSTKLKSGGKVQRR